MLLALAQHAREYGKVMSKTGYLEDLGVTEKIF